ncbi:MAG: SRPBCC family protein, partial [Acidimicrobiia bacterium]
MTSGDTSGIRATFDMVINRNFVAPVDEVWKAWTEGDYLREWWGPTGFTAPVAEIDVREGGTSLVAMRAPDDMGGFEHFHTWTYRKVVPNERLEFVQHFTDREGRPIDPASVGMPDGIPMQVPHVLTFAPASGGGTDFTVTEHGYTS